MQRWVLHLWRRICGILPDMNEKAIPKPLFAWRCARFRFVVSHAAIVFSELGPGQRGL